MEEEDDSYVKTRFLRRMIPVAPLIRILSTQQASFYRFLLGRKRGRVLFVNFRLKDDYADGVDGSPGTTYIVPLCIYKEQRRT